MCHLYTLIIGLVVFLIDIVNGQLSTCKYLQYDLTVIKLIDQCLAQSIGGVATSNIISCDEKSGKGPIFTKSTYNGQFCTGRATKTQTFDNSNLDSYNCGGDDCAAVFRLYQTDTTVKGCAKSGDFEDVGVIKRYAYQSPDYRYCTEYDCMRENVPITDCFNMNSLIINYTVGVCDPLNAHYFDSLLHCGEYDAFFDSPFHPPAVSNKSPAPTKQPSYKPTSDPSQAQPTFAPNINMTILPITSPILTTADWWTTNKALDGNNSGGHGIIYSLPAIPIEAICFLITFCFLVMSVFYLCVHKNTKNAVEFYLKPFVICTFMLNSVAILCIAAVSIILQTVQYNQHTRNIVFIPYCIASVCYVLGRFCLESVFVLRVYGAFQNNIFKISKPVLVFLFIWMTIVSVLWSMVFLMDEDIQSSQYFDYLYILVAVLDALLVLSILYLFMKRLQRVIVREAVTMRANISSHTASTTSANTINIPHSTGSTAPKADASVTEIMYNVTSMNKLKKISMYCCCALNDEEIKSIKSDLKSQNSSLVFIMTKLCLLSSISLISTSIFGIYLFYELSVEQRYIAYALWAIDVCVNSSCLFLNFSFSNNIYKKVCNLPHNACRCVMENMFAAKISSNANQQNVNV